MAQDAFWNPRRSHSGETCAQTHTDAHTSNPAKLTFNRSGETAAPSRFLCLHIIASYLRVDRQGRGVIAVNKPVLGFSVKRFGGRSAVTVAEGRE